MEVSRRETDPFFFIELLDVSDDETLAETAFSFLGVGEYQSGLLFSVNGEQRTGEGANQSGTSSPNMHE